VGLIGFGYAGQTFHAPLIQATPGLVITVVGSSDPGRVHAALGPQVAVVAPAEVPHHPDVDWVVIATPNEHHHPLARAAILSGRHVVIDKPFALDSAQAAELVALAQHHGVQLSVFHNRRWDSDFLTLAHAVRTGAVGRPVELVSRFDRFRPQVRPRWREGNGPGAGLWLDLGPHLLDQVFVLFGQPQTIALDAAAVRDGALADDWFFAQLHWTTGPWSGLRVHLHASTLAAHPGPRFELHGTQGSWVVHGLDPQEDQLKAGATAAALQAPRWGHDTRTARLWQDQGTGTASAPVLHECHQPLLPGNYPAYYAGMAAAIRGDGAAPVLPHEALAVQQWLDAGLRSLGQTHSVACPPRITTTPPSTQPSSSSSSTHEPDNAMSTSTQPSPRVAPPSRQVFATTRSLPQSATQVFEAITNPALLAQWWGPDGFRNTFHTFTCQTGGAWEFTMHGPDGTDYPNTSVFTHVLAGERVVIRHTCAPLFTLTLGLVPTDQGTHIDWCQVFDSPLPSDAVADFIRQANEQNLDRWAQVLNQHLAGTTAPQ
jgi:predicted dehydrogenase/uncharacterized protein YndB with AHSA1/START domain